MPPAHCLRIHGITRPSLLTPSLRARSFCSSCWDGAYRPSCPGWRGAGGGTGVSVRCSAPWMPKCRGGPAGKSRSERTARRLPSRPRSDGATRATWSAPREPLDGRALTLTTMRVTSTHRRRQEANLATKRRAPGGAASATRTTQLTRSLDPRAGLLPSRLLRPALLARPRESACTVLAASRKDSHRLGATESIARRRVCPRSFTCWRPRGASRPPRGPNGRKRLRQPRPSPACLSSSATVGERRNTETRASPSTSLTVERQPSALTAAAQNPSHRIGRRPRWCPGTRRRRTGRPRSHGGTAVPPAPGHRPRRAWHSIEHRRAGRPQWRQDSGRRPRLCRLARVPRAEASPAVLGRYRAGYEGVDMEVGWWLV